MRKNQEDYDELSYYTLAHSDPAFIHQHIVDAYAAQTADKHTKPITLSFALIGLYLYLEKKFTGKGVQQAHMRLANKNKKWPIFLIPENIGSITVADVIKTKPGKERDAMIQKWCKAVWDAYSQDHKRVEKLINKYI